MDDPSARPYLYTDGLSDELPFFAQARPRRMIRLWYKSGHWILKRENKFPRLFSVLYFEIDFSQTCLEKQVGQWNARVPFLI